MKKIIFLLIAFVGFYSANAQTALTSSAYPANTIDTVTNTATKTLQSANLIGAKSLGVVVTVTEISGTTAGAVTLEASVDGSIWYSIYNSMDSVYTFSPADQAAAQSYRFKVPDFADKYIRVKYVGAGTMSAKVQAKVYAKF